MADIQSILDPLPISKSVKADTWDVFHATGTPEEFRAKLDKLDIPKETKAALWDARNAGAATKPEAASPLSNLGSAFWEGIGGNAMMDIMGARTGDPERVQKAKDTVKGLVHGIVNEPSRFQHEGAEFYKSLILGDKPSEVASHLAGSVPFVGAGAQQVQHDFENKDYATGFGHALALLLPFAAKGAKVPESVANAAETAARGVGNLAGTATDIALHPATREAIGIAAPPVKHALDVAARLKRAMDAFRGVEEAKAKAPAAAPAVVGDPAQFTGTAPRAPSVASPPGPVPVGLGLPPDAVPASVTPSGTVQGAPAGGVTAAEVVRVSPEQFARMSAADQAAAQSVADRLNAASTVQPVAAAPPPSPAPAPVTPQAPPAAPQPIQAVPPVVEAPVPVAEPPAPSVAQQLRESLVPESTAAPGQVATIAPTEPEFQQATYEGVGRASKMQNLSKALFDNDISYDEAVGMDMEHWRTLAKAIGEKAPSKDTIQHALLNLRNLEKSAKPATPARAEQSAVTVPGPNGTSNGKPSITEASRALAEEMQRGGTLEPPAAKTRRARR